MNDNQIIKLFFTRNEDAIAQTACKYGTRLTGLAANIVRNNEDAQECVNDTYLKAWDTIPPTKPDHFFAYLAKICRFFFLWQAGLEQCRQTKRGGCRLDAGNGGVHSRLLA